MKLSLLLALLFGAASAFHLKAETPNLESPLEKETLPEDGDVPEQEADEAPTRELMLPEEEEEGSGSEDALEEEEDAEPASALGEADKDFQCPKEEDTVKLDGIPGCKTCRFFLVRSPRQFNQAQNTCQRCYRGNLVSIHNYGFNYRLQASVSGYNQAQVWIGGRVIGWGKCKRFRWVDGSVWNFGFWAAGQPGNRGGRCVTLCTRGGHWRRAHCGRRLSFICAN
ncbi:bone marrow proteoglycan [Choloepus didactylus]|uniref:bone marrow proteoglycan n=1 Tax=Choloepus didactylus TaxID=27675 RepID=UPI00189EF927|nr:bone marrow proteoglycan [Choloepus didactylus]XP_037695337.1 bone marrow proteoglycan [Choloepus didactylus]XP_037695338.1 bone marrow proteoglycan [Choloepus didactylus]